MLIFYLLLNNEIIDVNLFGGKYFVILLVGDDFNLFFSFGGFIFGSMGLIMF